MHEHGDDIGNSGMEDIASGHVDVVLVTIAESSLMTTPRPEFDGEVVYGLYLNMLLL